MITLHESNITSFPHDNGIGVLRDVIRAYAEEELNGMFEFYMEYDSEGFLVDELKEERIIKAKAQDKLGYQLFRIYSITKNHENDNIIVNAQHITYDLANNFVEKMEARSLTKKQVMEKIGASTVIPHPFNVTSSNTTTVSSTNLYRTNPLQMIGGMDGSVLQIWGGQIERDNFNLILHDRRGSDDGVKVTYEKNITGLTAEFDIGNLVTRIFPFVFIEGSDNEPARLITVSGKYIDSPLINNYEKIYIEPIDYSSDERIDIHEKTDAQIRQQLTNIASKYFEETGNDKRKATMEVQFEHLWETEEYKDLAVLEFVGMGDTVTIEHSRLKVNATAIVNYIRYDCIAEKNEEVRLGSVKARLTDNVNKVVDVAEKAERAEQTANQAIRAANGKTTIYSGPDEPTTGMQKGDLWFKVVDNEWEATYIFDGIEWQMKVNKDSAEAKAEAQQAKVDAQSAVDRANQATQQATNAINQAQTAFDEAQTALTTVTGLQGDVVNLSTLVDDHTGQISSITQSVGNLTTRIGDAEGNITTLQQTSNSLAGRLNDAEGNITTLTATVNGLQTTVTNVQGDVSNVTQLANALQTRMTNAEGDISTLTQTADSLQTQIANLDDDVQSQFTQLSNNINLRVMKGDVINQINLDTSGVLISGKKLVLDGDTTVTGTFSVGNANITSVDAGKVTVGELVGHSLVGGSVIGGYIEQQSGSRKIQMYSGQIDSLYNNQLAMRFGQFALEFYNQGGNRIGKFGPTVFSGSDSQGLTLSVEQDYISISHQRDGIYHPAFRTQDTVNDRSTFVAGPYATDALNQSTQLSLYANSRVATSTPRSTNQASIRLTHSQSRSDVLMYLGSTTRSGAFEIRSNIDSTTSVIRMSVTDSRITLQTPVYFGSNYVRVETGANYVRWHYDVNNFIRQFDTGRVDIVAGNNVRHSFRADGTKTGGTIELDGKIWGMSPIDSPQNLIEYIMFDVEVEQETIIIVDSKFLKSVTDYAVFSSRDFDIKKDGNKVYVYGDRKTDLRFVGKRKGTEHQFWIDMDIEEEEELLV